MKVFELAKELGITSKQLLALLPEAGLPRPVNHFAALSDETADSVRRHFIRRVVSQPASAQPDPQPQPTDPAPSVPASSIVVRKKGSVSDQGQTVLRRPQLNGGRELPGTLFGVAIKTKHEPRGGSKP